MANSKNVKNHPFMVKDCALIALASGKKVQNLREMRDVLYTISPDSIYYHFWGGLLRPRFDNPEYHNDFAIWSAHSLHDKIMAERLAIIDPIEFNTLEDLRSELVDLIEERLDEVDYPIWSKRDEQFEFIRSQIVIFDTRKTVLKPGDLPNALPHFSVGSIFYHFIDARRRLNNSLDDFQNWFLNFGDTYTDLCYQIAEIDPYFLPLSQLRQKLTSVFTDYFKKEKN
jgi:hypothetical protein